MNSKQGKKNEAYVTSERSKEYTQE